MVTEFYVIFANTDMWYKFFLKKNFGHCSILKKVSCERYILIEPYTSYVGAYLVDYSFLDMKMQKAVVLYVQKDLTKVKSSINFFTPRTCVTAVKSVIGVEDYSWTPYQLYNHLLAHGAVKLN